MIVSGRILSVTGADPDGTALPSAIRYQVAVSPMGGVGGYIMADVPYGTDDSYRVIPAPASSPCILNREGDTIELVYVQERLAVGCGGGA